MSKDFYVYALFRADGRPFYIGKGRGNRARETVFKTKQENTRKGRIISRTLTVLGDVPVVKLLENLTERDAFLFEKLFIKILGRGHNSLLCNMTDGGDGMSGHKHSRAFKKRHSIIFTGRRFSRQTHEKMSASAKVKIFTDEHKRNLRLAARKRKLSKATRDAYRTAGKVWKGRKHTAASRAKMSKSHTGKVLSAEHKANISKAQRRLRNEKIRSIGL